MGSISSHQFDPPPQGIVTLVILGGYAPPTPGITTDLFPAKGGFMLSLLKGETFVFSL